MSLRNSSLTTVTVAVRVRFEHKQLAAVRASPGSGIHTLRRLLLPLVLLLLLVLLSQSVPAPQRHCVHSPRQCGVRFGDSNNTRSTRREPVSTALLPASPQTNQKKKTPTAGYRIPHFAIVIFPNSAS
jgi:hypothetical protein